MKDRKIVFGLVIAFLVIVMIEQIYLLDKIQTLEGMQPKDTTALAVGQVAICVNNQPEIFNDCAADAYINQQYYCDMNSSDVDADQILEHFSTLVSGPQDIFTIQLDGTINFTPTAGQNGSYLYNIIVMDSSNCSNNQNSVNVPINIACLNQPPTFTNPCNNTAYGGDRFECVINASDPDGPTTFTYHSAFVDRGPLNYSLFTVGSTDGVINFTPDDTEVGSYRYRIIVYDNETCNNYALAEYDFDVYCGNTAPLINFTCNMTAPEDEVYSCIVQVIDNESSSFTFTSSFLSNNTKNYTLFNISSTGNITFTPNETQIGNYSFMINVSDGSPCNSLYSGEYVMEVINTNDAPIFNGTIGNRTWTQGTTLGSFVDLDDFFSDPDGDNLTYYYTALNYIRVDINQYNEVTLTPTSDYVGTQYLTFLAQDPWGLNASSNAIRLTVVSQAAPPSETPASTGSSGGGGGSSYPDCVPAWYCRPWGPCTPEDIQERHCFDQNECDTNLNKPNTTQDCNFIHTCYDGILGPDEIGIDCGGICPPCASCFDGIKNQDEEGIDCGGQCRPCSVVEQDIKEEETTTRPVIEIPEEVTDISTLMLIGMGLLLLLLIAYFVYKHRKEILKPFGAKKKAAKKKAKEAVLEEEQEKSLLEKLATLEKKVKRAQKDQLVHEFAEISRNYFRDLFNLEREMTFGELKQEIKARHMDREIKKALLKFIDDSIMIEYGGEGITKAAINDKILEFIGIIKLTSVSMQPIESKVDSGKGFHEKVETARALDEFFLTVSECNIAIDSNDLNFAYNLYLKAHKTFVKLPEAEQKRTHKFLQNCYDKIKKQRESLKSK